MQEVDFAAEYFPAGQFWHALIEVLPVFILYVPAEQDTQDDLPSFGL